MGSAIGTSSVWLRGNTTQVVVCSYLCKQHMFSLQQGELGHAKQRLRYSVISHTILPQGDVFRRRSGLQKHSHTIILMTRSVCAVHERPPSKAKNSVDERVPAPSWHGKCAARGLFGSFSSFYQPGYSTRDGDWGTSGSSHLVILREGNERDTPAVIRSDSTIQKHIWEGPFCCYSTSCVEFESSHAEI